MADSEIGLAEAIEVVRGELRQAQDAGRKADVRFSVGSVEVELAIEIVKKTGGEASIKVLSVLSLGGKREVSKGDTHRVKVTLNPIGVGGEPFEIASAQDRRPDAGDESSDVQRSVG
jgi:NTP-dependent ternary system trypsin peptidase co-occuring protein